MIKPPSLKKGDCIGLISTARKISKEELEPSMKIFDKWGLKVKFASHLFEVQNQFAGSDEQRLADLQGFIDNPELKAIICVRGGYGTVRIIDELNFLSLLSKPKWVCGFSDVTVLLNKLNSVGIECLHSSMPISFPNNSKESIESLRKVLFGEEHIIKIPSNPLNRNGKARGKVIGGNLSILYSQLGSPTAFNTEGQILFIEDLDEYLYHIDRMVYNLKRNSYFEKLAGLIVGGMSSMNDNSVPFGRNAEEIISDIVRPYNFPVCFGFPAGHVEDNRSLIFGRRANLLVGYEVELEFEHGPT